MKAVLLAAGLGARLGPLTGRLPKSLLKVGDFPVIYYSLFLLRRYGITDVFVNLHHCGEKIVREVGNGLRFGMKIIYSEEPEILGTAGALKRLARELSRGTFLVINSDILIDLNLDKVVEFHHRKRGAATLVLRHDDRVEEYGAIDLDAKGAIRDILGKVDPKPAGRGVDRDGKINRMMFTGVHVLEPKVLDFIPPRRFHSITDTYIEMLRSGERLFGYPMKGFWTDIGIPSRYRRTRQVIRSGRVVLPHMKGARVEAINGSDRKA